MGDSDSSYDSDDSEAIRRRKKRARKLALLKKFPPQSYLSCKKSAYFTIQVPPTGTTKPHWQQYTIVMEIMIERLPPQNQLMALATYMDNSLSPQQQRQIQAQDPGAGGESAFANMASLYLDWNGHVHNGDLERKQPVSNNITDEAANQGDLPLSLKDDMATTSTPQTEPSARLVCEVVDEDDKKKKKKDALKLMDDDDDDDDDDEDDEMPKEAPKGAAVRPKEWVVVAVVVDGKAGVSTTFVNGRPCAISKRLYPTQDLSLVHQITGFGGGKLSESRGGNLRRLEIFDEALGDEEVLACTRCVYRNVKLENKAKRAAKLAAKQDEEDDGEEEEEEEDDDDNDGDEGAGKE